VFNLPAKVSTLVAGLLDYFRQALLQGCRAERLHGYTLHGCMPRHDLTGEQGSDLMHLRLNICCSCDGCLLRRAALISDLLEPCKHIVAHIAHVALFTKGPFAFELGCWLLAAGCWAGVWRWQWLVLALLAAGCWRRWPLLLGPRHLRLATWLTRATRGRPGPALARMGGGGGGGHCTHPYLLSKFGVLFRPLGASALPPSGCIPHTRNRAATEAPPVGESAAPLDKDPQAEEPQRQRRVAGCFTSDKLVMTASPVWCCAKISSTSAASSGVAALMGLAPDAVRLLPTHNANLCMAWRFHSWLVAPVGAS
jgi:hypothetical protein